MCDRFKPIGGERDENKRAALPREVRPNTREIGTYILSAFVDVGTRIVGFLGSRSNTLFGRGEKAEPNAEAIRGALAICHVTINCNHRWINDSGVRQVPLALAAGLSS